MLRYASVQKLRSFKEWLHFTHPSRKYPGDEPPLRSELFSTDQMKEHGKGLAGSHKLDTEGTSNTLLARLDENEDILVSVYGLLNDAAREDRRIEPAGEWLLDNFYLVEEQIRLARRHLPRSYSRELPRLMNGPSAGLPRVYDIALETISHGDGRLDMEGLASFVASYQTLTILKLGELWAIPTVLRLALIENLRRVGTRMAIGRIDRNRADYWANRIIEIAKKDPKSLILTIADMTRSSSELSSAFVAEVARRLQGQGSSLALPLTWIEQRLSESGLTIKKMVQSENQEQATDQVSISNSIGSLRLLAATDWREFVESMSAVDLVLREDPTHTYADMNFATRDHYRHIVERIARRAHISEKTIASRAIELAVQAFQADNESRASHVGFYLVDKGLPQLERASGVQRSLAKRFCRALGRFPLAIYSGTIGLVTALVAGSLFWIAFAGGIHGAAAALLSIVATLSASYFAVAIVNWIATLWITADSLPRMDFSEGIPPESRTLTVIPTMLSSFKHIEDLVEALEVRFLANRDDNLHFALLTDFCDASEESVPEDEHLLRQARTRIEELNEKYRRPEGDAFFLFHRSRRWNRSENLWIGHERKRGKLADLNALLRNAGAGGTVPSVSGFSLVVGNTAILAGVKYVITLDTDTQLPRDSARELVGAIAHPLNRPRYDPVMKRVSEGYGILQPRVAVSLPGTNRSSYARMFGNEPGIDPYTRAVSDVYQDVFGEGSFVGKGIYDVDAFELSLAERLPENLILSHDLIEGCYARSALVSDVQLYEEYPSHYRADVNRRRRWIRGDWQIAQWLLPRIPGFGGRSQSNPISMLSRWKIFDNLRRSLVPAALTIFLLLAWSVLPARWCWTLSIAGIILIPTLLAAIAEILRKPVDVRFGQHLESSLRSTARRLEQLAFSFACLPHEALFSLGAIARTIVRMFITRKHLLEWNPSRRGEDTGSIGEQFRSMWIGPAIAIAMTFYLMLERPGPLAQAAPLLGLWLASPFWVWWVGQPRTVRAPELRAEQREFLQQLSRKTWAFFETFVGAEDNWLPPDNFQESPNPVVSHRTSPTNIGLALLSNLTAYDFGYISSGQLIERTSNTFRSMTKLERYRGHFYNWYDTVTLRPLLPLYISSVDSGNLAGHLLTLRSGLLALLDQPILAPQFFEGIRHSVGILMEVAEIAAMPRVAQIQTAVDAVRQDRNLERLSSVVDAVAKSLEVTIGNETRWWVDALNRQCQDALRDLVLLSSNANADPVPTLRKLSRLDSPAANRTARERIAVIEQLVMQAGEFANVEYDFLLDRKSRLLTIGYNASEHRPDPSHYDLLASEARLASFVAIAQGHAPQEIWFALGRLLTGAGGDPVLISWSGSMFEYLMPLLVMPTYENTLLDQTYRGAVKRQIEYGEKRGVPWGISECGYNTMDAHHNYQYRAFGVPGLGFKSGLAGDLVVAPYASALALMVDPEHACSNLQRLADTGLAGRYGLYEAIDFTPSRLPRGRSNVVIRSFMAHHQGMSFLSLSYLLLDRPMQKRFESDPSFQATMLLLQERIPKATRTYPHSAELDDAKKMTSAQEPSLRIFSSPHTPTPEVQLLSNGSYHVMLTNAGGGYSRWKDIAVTRWREDSTRDNWGTFCYIRDVISGVAWSAAHQPTLKPSERYEAIFSESRVEFRRRDNGIEIHTEIAVSPEDDIELRRVSITNSSKARRTLDVTSYAEVVLASSAADALHPAFSNLFVQTEILPERRAILCTRRPRSANEPTPWMFHLMVVEGAVSEEVSFETDRMRFIGRGKTISDPMAHSVALTGSEGSVLDPIVAVRHRITLLPQETIRINIVSGVAETRELCMELVDKYQEPRFAERTFDLAWTHSQVLLRQINATEGDAQLYGRLAGSVIYANSSLRANPNILIQNRRNQSGLWGYTISGDLPIVLLRIADPTHIELVRQLVQAHAYWRLKGLVVDLVIWNEDQAGYRQPLNDQIMGLIAAGIEADVMDRPGGILVRLADHIAPEDRILLQTVARAVIADTEGTLEEQVIPRIAISAVGSVYDGSGKLGTERKFEKQVSSQSPGYRDLIFFNGFGGFTPDGREYVITISHDKMTPAPWVNVIANSSFGSVVSETGAANTWSENAHEFRLTPWSNDPVSDPSGEAFYIRDDESGDFWSPTLLPCGGKTPYIARHGFGYSVFEHTEDGIRSELWVYVAIDSPIKFAVLKLQNHSGRPRRLSVFGYVEWVLGDLRSKSMMHVVTDTDIDSGATFAHNSYSTEFGDHVAFFDVNLTSQIVTGDRTEFLGRNGTASNPAAMRRSRLSGRLTPGLDPCTAIQVPLDLAEHQEREIVFTLGSGHNLDEARSLAVRSRGSAAARYALEAVWLYWNKTLGAVQVETPDSSVNVLLNGWLMYQTLACRFWARSGFYQPGGAYGFRDQLQDAMALIHSEPRLLREHLLACAAHQFREGDVQHWWHPPSDRGVRTRCSDDYLWLPLAVCRYVTATGDTGIWDEPIHFIEGRALKPEEESYYDLPIRSDTAASLYDHCMRAVIWGLRFGEHGLPLMGSGDWNDGMNLVGQHGKGESVWLAFFLHEVLKRFSEVARLRGDAVLTERCRSEMEQLRENIEKNGWDGKWYRRAYFDDGSPLGSETNTECQIDSISQSWSVLSGAADMDRSRQAMTAVDERLVRRTSNLVQLLDPPFDKSSSDPGYIKGYDPGVRENGGQYTHAAIWSAMAFAQLGQSDKAWELLGMINPVNRGGSSKEIAKYRVEPYVVAADVYARPPHTGRGGWTWYTGSAGWMYRLITESLLGLRLEVNNLYFSPRIPSTWNSFKVHYRYRETVYHITILRSSGEKPESSVLLDGVRQAGMYLPLVDDNNEHSAVMTFHDHAGDLTDVDDLLAVP